MLYQAGKWGAGITGMMFCHQISGPITAWVYKREGL